MTSTPTANVLSDLAYYEDLRSTATDVRRDEGNNVDIVTLDNGDEVPFCHLSFFAAMFPTGDRIFTYDIFYAVTRAVQDLNAGDGTVVPALQGLDQRCPIRFTMESAQTYFSSSEGLGITIEQLSREPGVERLPCAFVGAIASSVSVPSSMATGLLGYPQVSGASTSSDLEDKKNHPLFGR